jgi:hypothetical protein
MTDRRTKRSRSFAERTRFRRVDDVPSTALRDTGGKTFDSMYAAP